MAAKIKKGDLIRVDREKFEGSLEAQASDDRLPPYLFETDGEVLDMKGDYVFVKYAVPTPAFWIRFDQLQKSAK